MSTSKMTDSEYPSNAIVLELLFGFIGLLGIGHIYAGAFFGGNVVLFAYISFLAFEIWFINSLLFPYKIALMGLVAMMFVQNLVVSVTSSSYVMNKKSNEFPKKFFCALGFIILVIFLFVEVTQEDKILRTGALFVFILSLMVIWFILKLNVFGTGPEEKQSLTKIEREVSHPGSSLSKEKP